jgi:hypothetical protein
LGYYERNLAILRERCAEIAEKVEKAEAIRVDEPDDLAADFLAELGKRGVVFLMGIGCGKVPAQIAATLTPKQGIVAYEADPGVLKYAMMRRSLAKFFNHPDLALFLEEIPDFGFVNALHTRIHNEASLEIEDKNSTSLHPEVYEKVMTSIMDIKSYCDVNLGTCLSLGKRFCDSIIRNVPKIMKSQGPKNLFGLFPDCPAVVISSGPSLDKEIATLKYAKGKVLLISIDTALQHLLNNGVVPDIVCGIDPLDDNKILYRKHRDLLKKIPAVLLAQYTPDIVATYPGPLFISAMEGNIMYQWFAPFWEDKGEVGCFGGSVSCFGVELAQYLGCKDIALVGQDLCYKKKFHAGEIGKLLHDLG